MVNYLKMVKEFFSIGHKSKASILMSWDLCLKQDSQKRKKACKLNKRKNPANMAKCANVLLVEHMLNPLQRVVLSVAMNLLKWKMFPVLKNYAID